jgi:hypothetical protein
MDIGYRSLLDARAWVRGKSTTNPKVNLDISGDFGFRIFGNPMRKHDFRMPLKLAFWTNIILL